MEDLTFNERVALHAAASRYREEIAQACLEDQGIREGRPGTVGHTMQLQLTEGMRKVRGMHF